MGTLASLMDTMNALSIYDVKESTLIYAELVALAEGLDIVNNKLQELERESFVGTSESYGIDFRERVLGALRSNLSLERRREMLIYQMGLTSNDYTRESMERALVVCGIESSVVEYPKENKLYINVIEILDNGFTEEQIKTSAQKFLPLHLDLEFDFRNFSWSLMEEKGNTFLEIDNKQMTWEEIDKYEEEK